jgi:hypothetical protein
MAINFPNRPIPRMDLGVALEEFNPDQEFIADKVLPLFPVREKKASLTVITRECMTKSVETKHGNGAAFPRVSLSGKSISYETQDHGLEGQLTEDDIQTYMTMFDAEQATVRMTYSIQMLRREERTAAALQSKTTFTGSDLFYDYSGSPWSNPATNIKDQIDVARAKIRANTGILPDSLAVSYQTYLNMQKNTGILAKFPGSAVISPALVRQELANLLDLKNLFVGNVIQNTADEGQKFASGDVWSNSLATLFKLSNGDISNPGLGKTLYWGRMAKPLPTVDYYYENQTKSHIYQLGLYEAPNLFEKYFGFLLQIETEG